MICPYIQLLRRSGNGNHFEQIYITLAPIRLVRVARVVVPVRPHLVILFIWIRYDIWRVELNEKNINHFAQSEWIPHVSSLRHALKGSSPTFSDVLEKKLNWNDAVWRSLAIFRQTSLFSACQLITFNSKATPHVSMITLSIIILIIIIELVILTCWWSPIVLTVFEMHLQLSAIVCLLFDANCQCSYPWTRTHKNGFDLNATHQLVLSMWRKSTKNVNKRMDAYSQLRAWVLTRKLSIKIGIVLLLPDSFETNAVAFLKLWNI